ncbi:hypothetical protein KKH03_01620 [Patescibacteria group bacterium]|nr:hypothetical protein [Patescibacteria group bacterium]
MKKLILIDGNAILHRAYHSLPPFKTTKGEITNAIFGFLRMLIDIYIKIQPDYLGIAWDRKAPTFRHEKYAEYKATRVAPPEDLYPQLPRLKEVLKAFNIPMMEQDGFEADDLLGAAANKAEKEADLETLIVTGDQDAMQLVSDKTHIMAPIKGISEVKMFDPAAVKEKYGIRPDQIIDYKALCGDTSDNIPGVPGIGPKNATQLLRKYNDLDNIYAHLAELPDGQKAKLEAGKQSAYMSRELATIDRGAPVQFNLEDLQTHDINYPAVEKLFNELEFRTLGKKLEQLKDIIRPAGQTSLF